MAYIAPLLGIESVSVFVNTGEILQISLISSYKICYHIE